MFFHVQDERWLQPIAIYLAAWLQAAPAGEAAGRVVSGLAGAIDIGLMFMAGLMLFRRFWIALAGAMLMMSMPAHWWFARLGTDAIVATPFVLLWLVALLCYWENDSPIALAVAGAALGSGLLAHPTAPLTLTWFWLLSLGALLAARRAAPRNVAALTAPFAVSIALLAIYFALHPEAYPDTFGRWAVLTAHLRFPLDGLRAQVNWTTLANRASLFWGLLDPSFLFFPAVGQRVAPVLFVSALLAPLGVIRTFALPSAAHRLLLGGVLLVPPAIASTFGAPRDLSAAVPMTIGITLISVAGLDWLVDRSIGWKLTAAVAAAISAYQLSVLV